MVTQEKKFDNAKVAINCFHQQDFKNKELVIIHDSGENFDYLLRTFSQQYPNDKIVIYSADTGMSLGDLRNLSLDKAKHPIICQWDDDDLYHPKRLTIQYEKLSKDNADFCFFTDQLHWFKDDGVFYWDDWNEENYPMNLIQGTIMGRKSALTRYPSLDRGEDTSVTINLVEQGFKVTTLENVGYLYIYVYDGKNVWGEDHHIAISQMKRYNQIRLEANKKSLIHYLADYDLGLKLVVLPHDKGFMAIQPKKQNL